MIEDCGSRQGPLAGARGKDLTLRGRILILMSFSKAILENSALEFKRDPKRTLSLVTLATMLFRWMLRSLNESSRQENVLAKIEGMCD